MFLSYFHGTVIPSNYNAVSLLTTLQIYVTKEKSLVSIFACPPFLQQRVYSVIILNTEYKIGHCYSFNSAFDNNRLFKLFLYENTD